MTAHSETRPHGRFLDLRRDLCVRLPAILAHRVAAHLNAVRVVNQPIENAVGGGGVAGLSTDRLQAFTNAADLALEALDSPQCAAVFNTSGTGSHTAQEVLEAELPFSVLINLRPGTEPTFYIGSINFGLLPADQIAKHASRRQCSWHRLDRWKHLDYYEGGPDDGIFFQCRSGRSGHDNTPRTWSCFRRDSRSRDHKRT
jgi:hypothetical protein